MGEGKLTDDIKLLAKAYFIVRGFNAMVSSIIDKENPNLDPYWALDEVATKLKELTIAFKN